jgi:mannosyltransferase OCH1-like enzyme
MGVFDSLSTAGKHFSVARQNHRFYLGGFVLILVLGTLAFYWQLAYFSLVTGKHSSETPKHAPHIVDYFWAYDGMNGPEGSIRQRLAEIVQYNPGNPKFERNIVQSWKEDISKTDIYRSWDQQKGDFERVFYIDPEQDDWVQAFASHNLHDLELAYFQLLKSPVVRSDFFRYFIIWAMGGIWADADTWLRRPFEDWISLASTQDIKMLESDIGMVIGVEHETIACQYIFAAKKGHPVLLELVADIVDEAADIAIRIANKDFGMTPILHTTGPVRFSEVVEDWIKTRWDLNFTRNDWFNLSSAKLFGDILVLPQWAFWGGYSFNINGPEANDTRICVGHVSQGSWLKDNRT